MRKDLKPRVISVERDGFGLTAPTEGYTYQDHASEVMRVLDHPDIEKAAFVAISGGTPYLAQTAAAMPDRVTSVHMLAVFSQYDPENTGTSGLCGLAEEKITGAAAYHAANPEAWWTLGENGPMRKIPGFTHASRNDGARAFSMRGQKMDGRRCINGGIQTVLHIKGRGPVCRHRTGLHLLRHRRHSGKAGPCGVLEERLPQYSQDSRP